MRIYIYICLSRKITHKEQRNLYTKVQLADLVSFTGVTNSVIGEGFYRIRDDWKQQLHV